MHALQKVAFTPKRQLASSISRGNYGEAANRMRSMGGYHPSRIRQMEAAAESSGTGEQGGFFTSLESGKSREAANAWLEGDYSKAKGLNNLGDANMDDTLFEGPENFQQDDDPPSPNQPKPDASKPWSSYAKGVGYGAAALGAGYGLKKLYDKYKETDAPVTTSGTMANRPTRSRGMVSTASLSKEAGTAGDAIDIGNKLMNQVEASDRRREALEAYRRGEPQQAEALLRDSDAQVRQSPLGEAAENTPTSEVKDVRRRLVEQEGRHNRMKNNLATGAGALTAVGAGLGLKKYLDYMKQKDEEEGQIEYDPSPNIYEAESVDDVRPAHHHQRNQKTR